MMAAADVIACEMLWASLEGNVFDVLPTIKPGSVHCVCTSPPYWMLRSYLPKGHALKHLELGSERTPAEFVANMVRVFGLVRDALHETGTVFLNMGDTYSHARGKRKPGDKHGPKQCTNDGSIGTFSPTAEGIENGSLCLIPQRLAIALSDDGWIVRSVIVWHKPAPMPSSVTGWSWRRCRVKIGHNGKAAQKLNDAGHTGRHRAAVALKDTRSERALEMSSLDKAEWADCPGCKKCEKSNGLVLRRGSWRPTSSWEPILMLAKSDRYFCDAEAVKLPPSEATVSRDTYTRILDDPDEQFAVRHDHETICTGANPRDVWTIASEPLKEKHYAAFPTELVDRCLRAGTSSKGYCPACGMPWVRIVESKLIPQYECRHGGFHARGDTNGMVDMSQTWTPGTNESSTVGWLPSCTCPENASPIPGLVLDPFAGSGRTLIAARRLGLRAIGIDLNPEYAAMSRRRIAEDNPIFNSLPAYESEPVSLFDQEPQ